MGEFEGKVAIVTGGARGIGGATVEALCADGAVVFIADVLDEGEAFAKKLAADGKCARFVKLDVTEESQWKKLVDDIVREFGHLDILVNNAGIGTFEDVEQETRTGWDKVIAINQMGVWLGMKYAAPAMKANGGSIVNVSSIFGAVGGFGASIAYHASKGAVRLMTKTAAIRYAKERIRVNSIHPGFIDTPMIAPIHGTPLQQSIEEKTPMGRLGTAKEIGDVIAFMCGPKASYMTGSEVYVDGGWTAA
ncbi:MAG TPA: SDR family oxidoreductase [Candidatus Limnocylindria bacterium]|nr:SDR family oxidoreductase [Candidatus Limnocylindria bacterium]